MKILFSDLDGTLVNGQQLLSFKNIEMMKELQKQGHIMVICTGRNIKEIERDPSFHQLPFDYMILNNGGHIVDKDYQTLYEKVIEKDVGVDILEHAMSYPDMWTYFCDGHVNYAYKNGVTYDHSIMKTTIDEDFRVLYQKAKHFQIICFNQDNEGIEDTQKCYDYIQEKYRGKMEAYFNTYFVDVVPYGCSKGTGIRQLLKIIQKPIEAVYAIGDSYNDISMIQEADFGYTFHHAHDDIKQATQYHVDYVYEVIEDMLGGKDDELAR